MKKWLFKMTDIFEGREEFLAVKRSMIAAIPILIVSSMAVMLAGFPLESYQHFIQGLAEGQVLIVLNVINSAALGLFSIVLNIAFAVNYANLKNIDNEAVLSYPIVSLTSYIALSGMNLESFQLVTFGAEGVFTALVSAVISCKLLHLFQRKISYSDKNYAYGVDHAFRGAVKAIIPIAVIITLFALFHQILEEITGHPGLHEWFSSMVTGMFKNIGNGLGAAIIFSLFTGLLWFLGIHGSNVFEVVAQNNFIEPVTINAENLQKGAEATEIFSKPFYDVFVMMGGCGVALSLLLAIFLVGKRNNTRGIAKMGLLPAIFNISEIVVFGLPVILTPIFLIPFVVVPVVLLLVSYGATAIGLVPCVSQNITWTTPVIFGGYIATGSLAGSILQVINLFIGALIYMPFVKLYEEKLGATLKERIKVLEKELWHKEEQGQKTDFLTRKDIIGSTARMLASDLNHALKKRELYFLYQPQVDINGKCIGAEALLRWNHPLIGNIIPPLVIAIAKEAGYLPTIEKYLFDETCSKIKRLNEEGKDLKISVNITADSLAWDGLESSIAKALEKHNVKPEQLWLEITEQDAWLGSQAAVDKIERLKAKGHKMLIDDFGMGHTSVLYLQTGLFDIVKLDGTLTRGIEKNLTNREIISSIVYLSKSLQFDIIAEFVEIREQSNLLAELGCTGFQGYLYSKPILFEEFEEYDNSENISSENI